MDYNKAIESICFKFGHAVTEYEVFRWLRNFNEPEWAMALHVLDKVVYYSSDRIEEDLNIFIKRIVEAHPGDHVYVLPTGNVGKSGNAMAYHAKKVIEALGLPERVLSLVNLKNLDGIKKKAVIALLDDFSGTGESIEKFYDKCVKEKVSGKQIEVCALTVAYMKKAADYLTETCNMRFYGTCYDSAFARRGSVFGYERNMKPVRDFCFKKGELLFPNWKHIDLKPLGYKNSQALICFEHTTPNNTLPILWYEETIPGMDKKWNAIFPRFANSRIDRGRRLRQSSNFWLSAMQKMHLPNIDWSIHHTNDSLRLISMVAQKYRKRSDLYIAQVLGISTQDVEEIVKMGQEKGLFDANEQLTIEARTIYEEIRKRDKILEKDIQQQMSRHNTERVYVPKSFRGLS